MVVSVLNKVSDMKQVMSLTHITTGALLEFLKNYIRNYLLKFTKKQLHHRGVSVVFRKYY